MSNIDETILTNKTMPKTWKCQHCGRRNHVDIYADEILIERGRVIRQCDACGYLHIWKLNLTEDFKQEVIDYLTGGT